MRTKIDVLMAVFMVFCTLPGIAFLIWLGFNWNTVEVELLFGTFFLFFPMSIVIFIELPKLKRWELKDGMIISRNLLTGKRKQFKITEFEGFKTTSQWTMSGGVDEVYLIKGRTRYVISSNYVKNYYSFQNHLSRKLVDLGYEKFEYFKYIKERLRHFFAFYSEY